jgi:hypothetical protein
MADPVSITVSLFALGLSAVTAWANLLRRGTVRMSKPAFIAFCYDSQGQNSAAKIFIRSLLYSTGKRGQIVETMYVVVHHDGKKVTFNVWGYGDDKLSRGSGLFVPETGVSGNHHFNPPYGATPFRFHAGEYRLEIFATRPTSKKPLRLCTVMLRAPASEASLEDYTAIWFDWNPEISNYQASIRSREFEAVSVSR